MNHHGTGPLGVHGSHRLCIAPMMDFTDRHLRALLRLTGPHTVLYTEMLHARAVNSPRGPHLLRHDPCEHPVALQLGGSDPDDLARAAQIGVAAGYDEINLNVGCPSERVASGSFGAVLMLDADRVARCVSAMRRVVSVPVTVKCRLGIIESSGSPPTGTEHLHAFVETVANAGCSLFIVHARDAVLGGLSPKENREVPPLRHAEVHELAARYPQLEFVINGGLRTPEECRPHLDHTEGVMVGRAACDNPIIVADLHAALFGSATHADSISLIDAWRDYVQRELAAGTPLHHMTRHLLGLFSGVPGARHYRRFLSEHARAPGASLRVLDEALARLGQRRAA